jgi:hypothetical protein
MMKITLAAFLLIAAPALAQEGALQAPPPCPQVTELSTQLKEKYGESLSGAGLLPQNLAQGAGQRVLALFNNPETGTFTIVIVLPDGKGCPIFDGERWRLHPNKAPDNTGPAL